MRLFVCQLKEGLAVDGLVKQYFHAGAGPVCALLIRVFPRCTLCRQSHGALGATNMLTSCFSLLCFTVHRTSTLPSFRSSISDSTCDLRFTYCACAVSALLGDWSGVDKRSAVEYIERCYVRMQR